MSEIHEKLILYHAGELDSAEREEMEKLLREDPELREELESLVMLTSLARERVPANPGSAYWGSFWERLRPQLSKKSLWQRASEWLAPRHGFKLAAAFGAIGAALVMAVLFLFQLTVPQGSLPSVVRETIRIKKTEGYLERVAADHLERSRLLLQEVVNFTDNGQLAEDALIHNRRRGEELLSDNRSFRMAAEREDDQELASLLEELEVVLLDIANLDPEVAEYTLPSLKRRIVKKNLLIKIDIVKLDEEAEPASSSKEVI